MFKKSFALITAGILAAGVIFGVASAADAAPTKPKAPTGISTTVTPDMAKWQSTKKGKTIHYGVDGAIRIEKMKWKVWNNKKATGEGVYRMNHCVPNCAESTSFYYRTVKVTATQPKKNKFTKIRIEGTFPISAAWVDSK